MRNNKVAIVSLGLSLGGTEKESVTLANFLCEKGYSIKYIAAYKSNHYFKLNSRIEFVEPSFLRSKRNYFIYLLKLVIFIRKEIKEFNPQSIISFNEWINPLVVFSNLGLKNQIHIRDVMNPKASYPFLIKIAKRFLYPKATSVLVQTDFAKDVLVASLTLKKVEIIPTQVQFVNTKTKKTEKRIITIGRLEVVKGHKYLIDAFAKSGLSNWELHIVGEGSLLGKLRQQSKDLQIDENVIFHGRVDDFSELLANSAIFVLPSLREGFPNALIEAMSVPLACVTSDFYEGRTEIIEHGKNGFLYPVQNTDELAKLLKLLAHNEVLRKEIATKAYEVRNIFAPALIGEKYLKIINDES